MNRKIYNFLEEPTFRKYRILIDYSTRYCDTFLLVIQDPDWFELSAWDMLSRLGPFLKEKFLSLEWPGTILGNGDISKSDHGDNTSTGPTIYKYYLNKETAEILKNATHGLYSWIQPNLPEDLSLLRPDGSPWLVSITHERDGYLELSTDEKEQLFEALPEIASILEKA
jgi:hypothetical protein